MYHVRNASWHSRTGTIPNFLYGSAGETGDEMLAGIADRTARVFYNPKPSYTWTHTSATAYQFLSGMVEIFFQDVERKLIAADVDRVPVSLLVTSVELVLRLLLKSFLLPAQNSI